MKKRAGAYGADDFFCALEDPREWLAALERVPGVHVFWKDARHRFLRMNRELLEMHGCASMEEVEGRDDYAFHPPAMAAQYQEEDRQVLDSGKPQVDRMWLVSDAKGRPRWYLSSKYPLRNQAGVVIGLLGVMREYGLEGKAPDEARRLTPVLTYVQERYAEPVSVEDLAREAHLSVSQLQREFRRLFGVSPREYVARVRLLMARRMLEKGGAQVGEVALECGFYDQSHFARSFHAATGMRPLEYRRRFGPRGGTVPRGDTGS
jgi:PAS domain S-box-containing protein